MLTIQEETKLINELIQEDDSTTIGQYIDIKNELISIMNSNLSSNLDNNESMEG